MAQPNAINTARGTILELPLPDGSPESLLNPPTPALLHAITCTPIDFATTLPVYQPYFAVVLDNVFSAEECAILSSIPDGHWTSLVQGNAFREVDRTLVLNRRIADALYARVRPLLEDVGVARLREAPKTLTRSGSSSTITNNDNDNGNDKPRSAPQGEYEDPKRDWSEAIAGPNNLKATQGKHKATWTMYGANERLSFLRYSQGMHHDRHCDQVFSRPDMDKEDKSFLTAQVYLSDAGDGTGMVGDEKEWNGSGDGAADAGAGAGGTTRFWGPPGSGFEECFVDVVPVAGRVLVFQQRMLWHSGQPVTAGLKYAMRTDLMYRRSFT